MSQSLKYASAEREFPEPVEGRIIGEIPSWIRGSLYRNGPGKYEVGDTKYNHLFDGLAMIHKYEIDNGKVRFRNQFVKSETYKKNMAANRIVVSEFGTAAYPDPCKSIFQRYFSLFFPGEFTDNTSVNIFPIGDELYASTETNILNRIDPCSLDTLGRVKLGDYVAVNSATAHPHISPDGTLYNMGSCYQGSSGPAYAIIEIPPPDQGNPALHKAKIVAKVPARWRWSPSYFHSFGMSEHYFILLESPLVMHVPSLMLAHFTRTSYVNAMQWWPEEHTLIHVIDRRTGETINSYTADAFFTFHHVNAFEDNGHLVIDCAAYKSGSIIRTISLDEMRKEYTQSVVRPLLRRYVLPLDVQGKKEGENLVQLENTLATAFLTPDSKSVHCAYETLSETTIELPTINYRQWNTGRYRYAYGLSIDDADDKLVKIDCLSKTSIIWGEKDCCASEPIYVPNPNGQEEDDGVILSGVQSMKDGKRSAFLLVLDAKSFKEIGRAEFPDVSLPTTFHGIFMPDLI